MYFYVMILIVIHCVVIGMSDTKILVRFLFPELLLYFALFCTCFAIAEKIFCFEAVAHQTKSSQYPLHVI